MWFRVKESESHCAMFNDSTSQFESNERTVMLFGVERKSCQTLLVSELSYELNATTMQVDLDIIGT